MPGFTTHYLFGLNSFRELEEPDLVSCIRKFPHAFCMGLQGPDIFFYYLPSYLRSSGNIGQLAHHKNTGVFLIQLLKSKDMFLKETEQQIAISYICGFLGHYVLDTTCHPYIFAKSHYGTYDKGYLVIMYIWKQILMQSFLPIIRTVRHLNSTRVPPCTSAGRNGTSLLLYY